VRFRHWGRVFLDSVGCGGGGQRIVGGSGDRQDDALGGDRMTFDFVGDRVDIKVRVTKKPPIPSAAFQKALLLAWLGLKPVCPGLQKGRSGTVSRMEHGVRPTTGVCPAVQNVHSACSGTTEKWHPTDPRCYFSKRGWGAVLDRN